MSDASQPVSRRWMVLAGGLVRTSTLAMALVACASASPSVSTSGSTAAVPSTAAETLEPSVASPSPTEAPGHTAVVVTDFAIRLSSASATAGDVTFDVKNIPAEPPYGTVHELVVVRTDLDAADLPTLKDERGLITGAIEGGLDIVGRTAHIPLGESASLTLNLQAGHYVLFCNLAGHYMFMRENFDVR